MDPLTAAAVLAGLVAAASVVGVLWRSSRGRVRTAGLPDAASVVTPADVGVAGGFGERATLLQFSTEFCAYCPATRRLLGSIADRTPGVAHVDVDLTRSPGVAQRFAVLQTPTTLLLDGDGAVRARIGGAPRPAELNARLAAVLEGRTDVAV